MQGIVGDDKDLSLLDGYDEVSEENQEKIREAVEQGHVADSDWKGVRMWETWFIFSDINGYLCRMSR